MGQHGMGQHGITVSRISRQPARQLTSAIPTRRRTSRASHFRCLPTARRRSHSQHRFTASRRNLFTANLHFSRRPTHARAPCAKGSPPMPRAIRQLNRPALHPFPQAAFPEFALRQRHRAVLLPLRTFCFRNTTASPQLPLKRARNASAGPEPRSATPQSSSSYSSVQSATVGRSLRRTVSMWGRRKSTGDVAWLGQPKSRQLSWLARSTR